MKILLKQMQDKNLSTGPAKSIFLQVAYIEDHEFVAGSGDLDEYNGRYCITPK